MYDKLRKTYKYEHYTIYQAKESNKQSSSTIQDKQEIIHIMKQSVSSNLVISCIALYHQF